MHNKEQDNTQKTLKDSSLQDIYNGLSDILADMEKISIQNTENMSRFLHSVVGLQYIQEALKMKIEEGGVDELSQDISGK